MLRTAVFCILLLEICLISQCDSKGEGKVKVNFREKEKQVLDQILGPGRYDARIRPSGENGTDVKHTSLLTMENSTKMAAKEMPLDKRPPLPNNSSLD